MDRIKASVASNGTLTPFQDGIAWEGVWTIPVCDIGDRVEWNTQFGDKKEGYGRLPCCCGINCVDTKDFVEAAGMKGFQTLIHGCKRQIKGDSINFNIIDYGFVEDTFGNKWRAWSTSERVGVIFGLIIGACGAFLVLVCIFSCFYGCFVEK